MSVKYGQRIVGFNSRMPQNTRRRHETPRMGDSQEAIKRARNGCLDFNVQAVAFNVAGTRRYLPVGAHWAKIGMNGYTHTTQGPGKLRKLTRAEKRMTLQQWVDRHGGTVTALNSLRKRARKKGLINDYPMTWAQAVAYADRVGTVLTPELKSRQFTRPDLAQHMVNVCKRHDYPMWSMSLLSMWGCAGKCAAVIEAGGQFALIFGRYRHLATGTNKIAKWRRKPTQIWGPKSAKQWLLS